MKVDTIYDAKPPCVICGKCTREMIVKVELNIYICIDCALGIYDLINEIKANPPDQKR